MEGNGVLALLPLDCGVAPHCSFGLDLTGGILRSKKMTVEFKDFNAMLPLHFFESVDTLIQSQHVTVWIFPNRYRFAIYRTIDGEHPARAAPNSLRKLADEHGNMPGCSSTDFDKLKSSQIENEVNYG
jgi:hypothetical protein